MIVTPLFKKWKETRVGLFPEILNDAMLSIYPYSSKLIYRNSQYPSFCQNPLGSGPAVRFVTASSCGRGIGRNA